MFQFSGCLTRSTLKSYVEFQVVDIFLYHRFVNEKFLFCFHFMRKHFEKSMIQGPGINKVDILL